VGSEYIIRIGSSRCSGKEKAPVLHDRGGATKAKGGKGDGLKAPCKFVSNCRGEASCGY